MKRADVENVACARSENTSSLSFTKSVRTYKQHSQHLGSGREAEMPACPPMSSPKKSSTPDPAPGAWPAIVARIADPVADAHRVLYLLEPWPECARIVHHIGGNGTTDQPPRGRRRKTAHDGIAPGRTDSTETGSVKTRANASSWVDCVPNPPLAPRFDGESGQPQPIDTTAMPGTADQHRHTQPAELRQPPAHPTASTKESGSWKT